MANINLFKSCNFKIALKSEKQIELMVQEVNLPGYTIGQIETRWQSMSDKRPGDSIEFNDLMLTVLIDEDLEIYKEIYNNLILQHNPLTNTLECSKQLFDGYLFLLTNKNNLQHKVHFYNCWIKSLDDVQLSHATSEDEQLIVTLNISYNFYMFE
jgi:hypothetical protein